MTLRWWVVLAALLLGAALITPFNHDETQYYAAARLAGSGLPYRDFIYLQTPLFAWWGGLLGLLAQDYLLVGGRIAQALMAFGILAIIHRTAVRATDEARAGQVAVALLATSYPFLFSATVFRNDLLPMLLETLAVAVLLPAARSDEQATSARMVLGGLLIGLAASAKVNFILLGLAPALWLALRKDWRWGQRVKLLVALAIGGLAGVLPIALAALPAPEQALWQVVTFGAEAPHEWYRLTGQHWRLTAWGRAADGLVVLMQGASLAILFLAFRARREADRQARLLDFLVIASLAAAFVPAPVWRQYFVVLLPPLAIRAAQLWPMIATRRNVRRAVLAFAAVGLVSGLVRIGSGFARLDDSIVARESDAHWLGAQVGRTGRIATLAPEFAIDSGASLDPAFAAGPFVYRWSRSPQFGAVAAANLAAHLDATRPIAIVTGEESDAARPVRDLDRGLRDWALRNGYKAVQRGDRTYYFAPLVGKPRGS